MEKKISSLMVVLGVFLLAGCNSKVVQEIKHYTEELDRTYQYDPESIMLDQHGLSMYVGEINVLAETNLPVNSFGSEVIFTSQDDGVATVNQDGLVTAVGPGKTTITCASKNNPDAKEVIPVNVTTEYDLSDSTQKAASVTKAQEMFAFQTATYPSAPEKIAKVEREQRIWANKSGDSYVPYMKLDNQSIHTSSLNESFYDISCYDKTMKAEGGNSDTSIYSWTFSTDADFNSTLFHVSGGVKNRMNIKTTSFIGQERYKVTYALLDGLFTSGHVILTNNYDDLMSSTDLKNYENYGSYISSAGGSESQFRYTYYQQGTDKSDASLEENLYIPAGTEYNQIVKLDVTWEAGLVRNYMLSFDIDYVQDGQEKRCSIIRNYIFYSGDEVSINHPDPKEYNQVYEIWDL